MAESLTDTERVLRLVERVRLLIALADDIPVDTKLNAQGLLKIFESTVAGSVVAHEEAAFFGRQPRRAEARRT